MPTIAGRWPAAALDPQRRTRCPAPVRNRNQARECSHPFARLRAAFGVHLPPWQDGVARMLDEVLGRRTDQRSDP